MRLGRLKRFAIALVLVAAPAAAWAMPPLLAAIATAVATAAGVVGVTFLGLTIGQWIFISTLVYGAVQARNARRDARNAYNASLVDRTVSVLGSEEPWRIVYGEATVGGVLVAILTSGDRDQFKHVVVVWACHECDAIVDTLIAGTSVGPLDANGWVTPGSKYYKENESAETETITISGSGVGTVAKPIGRFLSVVFYLSGDGGPIEYGPAFVDSVSGNTFQLNPAATGTVAGQSVICSYVSNQGNARLRVRHHLGADDQVADPALMAELPGEWTASDRLRGLCYSIWTLDLEEPEFQGGPVQFQVRMRGKRLYDHRTGLTVWNDNAALCNADFIRAEYGKRATFNQVIWPKADEAANACDETLPEFGGAKRFTCNGMFKTDQDPDVTLDQLAQSMAGFAVNNGGWYLQAGVFTPTVMDLTDADNAGSVELVESPESGEVFNGCRGKFYDTTKFDQLTDYPPYQNAAFVAEDNGPLWTDLHLPFTNEAWRAHNLARIFTERSRGTQLVYPAKLRTLKLKPGQRVRLSNSFLTYSLVTFRVVKRDFAIGGQPMLTLARDDPSYYDLADAPASLPPPASSQPDPFVVAPVTGLVASTGGTLTYYAADGAALGRVRLTYDASTDGLVVSNGALQVEYRLVDEVDWTRIPESPGSSTQTDIGTMRDNQAYLVRARWRNGLGAVSAWYTTTILVRADADAPADAAGLGYENVIGGQRVFWTAATEGDYLRSRLRRGATFEAGSELFLGDASEHTWVPPTDGTYKLWLVHYDRSGNASAPVSIDTNYVAMGGGGGLNIAEVYLYQRTGSATPPASVSVALDYAFSTGVLSGGSLGAWLQAAPSSGGAYLWRDRARAIGSGSSDSIAPGEWAGASLLAVDGADGAPGSDGSDGAPGAPGAPAVTGGVDKPAVVLPAWSDGVLKSGAVPVVVTAFAKLGGATDTSNWTWARSATSGITTTIAGAAVTITAMDAGLAAGEITITGSRSGFDDIVIVVAVSKALDTVPSAGPTNPMGNHSAGAARATAAGTVTTTAGFELRADGTIYARSNASGSDVWTKIGDWYLPTGSPGANYNVEFKALGTVIDTTGTGGTLTGTLNSAEVISSTRAIVLSRTASGNWTIERTFTYTVRRVSDGAQVGGGNINIAIEREVI